MATITELHNFKTVFRGLCWKRNPNQQHCTLCAYDVGEDDQGEKYIASKPSRICVRLSRPNEDETCLGDKQS